MKKIALATLLALVGFSASAVEVGVVGGTDFYNQHGQGNRGSFGLTVGEHFGAFSLAGEADREIKKDTDKFSLIGGYDVTKLGTATLTAKAGATYVKNSTITGNNHYAGLVGAGLTVPVTTKVGLTVDYRYEYSGNAQAKAFNGNTVLVGAKYAF